MKVKNLPSVIKKRAKIYIKENFPDKKTRPSKLINSFDWLDTIEGIDYWEMVNEGIFLDAENYLREKNGDDMSEELFEVEKTKKRDRMIELIEDAHWNIEASKSNEYNNFSFFFDEILDINVNEVEVVPYKEELEVIDPIVEAVREKLKQRSSIGIKKYGTTLAENNTDNFLNHLQEELMDAILYIEKLKNK
jgi:hypothetical protein